MSDSHLHHAGRHLLPLLLEAAQEERHERDDQHDLLGPLHADFDGRVRDVRGLPLQRSVLAGRGLVRHHLEVRGLQHRGVDGPRVPVRSGPRVARQVELAALLQLLQDEVRGDLRRGADDPRSVSEVHERVLPPRLGRSLLRGHSPDALSAVLLRLDGRDDHHEVAHRTLSLFLSPTSRTGTRAWRSIAIRRS